MNQSQEMSGQEKEALAGDVMNSLGEPESATEGAEEPQAEADELPKPLKERLGRQEKRHQKELRALRAQVEHLQANKSPDQSQFQPANTYDPQPIGGDIESHIHRAVNAALQAKDQQERDRAQAERQAHVHKQYQALQDHLDSASGKYEDFDDVVRSHDVPFTEAMRDTALLLPTSGPGSASDVLYKLGKNREELKRVSMLHPLEQAKEMVKLSTALQGGVKENSLAPRQLGNIKSNPVAPSGSVNENTSVGELRRKLKQGWK